MIMGSAVATVALSFPRLFSFLQKKQQADQNPAWAKRQIIKIGHQVCLDLYNNTAFCLAQKCPHIRIILKYKGSQANPYAHACTRIHIQKAYAHVHKDTHAHTQRDTYKHIHTHIRHTHAYTRTRTHTHTHTHKTLTHTRSADGTSASSSNLLRSPMNEGEMALLGLEGMHANIARIIVHSVSEVRV